jgi:hypothetical protein
MTAAAAIDRARIINMKLHQYIYRARFGAAALRLALQVQMQSYGRGHRQGLRYEPLV